MRTSVIGNYGIQPMTPDEYGLPTNAESDHAQAHALIVSDKSDFYSHWNAAESLEEWMKREKVVGIQGVDTRELTKHIRNHGSMTAKILFDGKAKPAEYAYTNMLPEVSVKEPVTYNEEGSKTVVLVDCGVKAGVVRCLINEDLKVVRVPWNYDYSKIKMDGLVISDGPGNPSYCSEVVTKLQKFMAKNDTPILGIVTAAVHWGFNSELALLLLTFQHWAGITPYTSPYGLA